MRKRYKVTLSIVGVLLAVIMAFIVWAETPLGPMSEVSQDLQSDAAVLVTAENWLVFTPTQANDNTGFIIYPGGRVDPKSYAPVAHAIAAKGYLTIIVPMPLNLAVIGINKADSVIRSYPEIKHWAIGGHSLGGTMAAQYAYNHQSLIQGIVFWAAYPIKSNDFSNTDFKVVTIHGTDDGLVSTQQIDDSMKLLPTDTVRVEIVGGNHAQFGSYGDQPGDYEATISRENQQEQIVNATVQLLENIRNQ